MRWRLRLHGIVQGVGFRPFVYRLSMRFGLRGFVRNEGGSVLLEVQGTEEQLERWKGALINERPSVARIDDLALTVIPDVDPERLHEGFLIEPSVQRSEEATPSPDLALCNDCRQEISDPSNRRFDYPFTNCTNCGPRFTIIHRMPYDRHNTTMESFPLCKECAAEYADPLNRRFHAEPVACPTCGPSISITTLTNIGEPMQGSELDFVARALIDGRIVGLKALGGWHLACDAGNEAAVRELRRRKERRLQPFAVMFRNVEMVGRYASLSMPEVRLLEDRAAPIVLLDTANAERRLAPSVHPETPVVGAMLPSTPLHELILQRVDRPLVMTSGNRSGAPTPYKDEAAHEEMKTLADIAVGHNRPILLRCDDSIVRLHPDRKSTVYYRRARGYAPHIISTPYGFARTTFAAGSFLNVTFAIGHENRIYMSPHLGDLDHPDAIEQYGEIFDHYCDVFDLTPEAYVCDLHPGYTSTHFAERMASQHGLPLEKVQHHEAHIASCLLENDHQGPALGLALDGTGYGRDGTSWGGELFFFPPFYREGEAVQRCASLSSLPMPGGDRAVQETDRMAYGLLYHAGLVSVGRSLGLFSELTDEAESLYRTAMAMFPKTSGCGRLFDAVSFLISGRSKSEYEGQPAIWLENCLPDKPEAELQSAYPFTLQKKDRWILDPTPMVAALLDDIARKESAATMSLRFHSGLVQGLVRMVEAVAGEKEVRTVALSGGCFFNRYLTFHIVEQLQRRNFIVLQHKELPPGDGGLPPGQLMLGGLSGSRFVQEAVLR